MSRLISPERIPRNLRIHPDRLYDLLAVDDTTSTRGVFVKQLEPVGYRVRTAGDVASACVLLSEVEFGIVVVDMKLPLCSGSRTLCDDGGLRVLGYMEELGIAPTVNIAYSAYFGGDSAVQGRLAEFRLAATLGANGNGRLEHLIKELQELPAAVRESASDPLVEILGRATALAKDVKQSIGLSLDERLRTQRAFREKLVDVWRIAGRERKVNLRTVALSLCAAREHVRVYPLTFRQISVIERTLLMLRTIRDIGDREVQELIKGLRESGLPTSPELGNVDLLSDSAEALHKPEERRNQQP